MYKRLFICLFSVISISLYSQERPNIHVCTVANFQCANLDNLLNSANHFDIKVNVLGMDQPYRNNFYKLLRMNEYLDTVPLLDVVLFVDAFDVLILADKDTILDKFLSKNLNCIFSSERRLYPQGPLKDLKIPYPEADSSFRYLNSGSYIGYVSFLKLMIEEIIEQRYSIPVNRYLRLKSDQFHCHRYFAQNQLFVKLDTQNELFLTLSNVDKSELTISVEDKSVVIEETGGKPFVIHGNGPGKIIYDELAEAFFP